MVESFLDEQTDDAVRMEDEFRSLRIFVANEREQRCELIRARQHGDVGREGHRWAMRGTGRAEMRGGGRKGKRTQTFLRPLLSRKSTMAGSRYAYVRAFELEDTLLPSTFLSIRLDGKGFHAFSKAHNFDKPNDAGALSLMNAAARRTMQCKELQGECVLAIGESDEFRCVSSFSCSSQLLTYRITFPASCLSVPANSTAGERGESKLQVGCQNGRSPLDSTANCSRSSPRSSPPPTSSSGAITFPIHRFSWISCQYSTVGQSSLLFQPTCESPLTSRWLL